MKSWILLFQTPYDTVKYITSELSTPRILGYYKFLEYISSVFIIDYYNFREELNKYQTILVNLDDHTWSIYKEEIKETTFKELLELNKKEEEQEESKSEKFKNFIKKFRKTETLKNPIDGKNYDSRNSDTRIPRVRV